MKKIVITLSLLLFASNGLFAKEGEREESRQDSSGAGQGSKEKHDGDRSGGKGD